MKKTYSGTTPNNFGEVRLRHEEAPHEEMKYRVGDHLFIGNRLVYKY